MRYLLLIFFALVALNIQAQEIIKDNKTDANSLEEMVGGPIMSLESTVVDYGTIEQNGEPLRKVVFTNVGDAPLVIQNARGSCGCTVPTWPKKPILPGETGEIEIRYATNRIGQFSKTVTLTTNETSGEARVIRVQGKVNKPEPEESVPEGNGLIKPGGGK